MEVYGFYGWPETHSRQLSWQLLKHLETNQDMPWLVEGDFNEIMHSFEMKGGPLRDEKQMKAFRDVLEECRLMDLDYFRVTHMDRERSDHCPIKLVTIETPYAQNYSALSLCGIFMRNASELTKKPGLVQGDRS